MKTYTVLLVEDLPHHVEIPAVAAPNVVTARNTARAVITNVRRQP